jgi:PAS domain S-box-containing protein
MYASADGDLADTLQPSEEMLRLAQDAGGVGSWEYRIGSGRVIWSDGARRLFGVSPGWRPSYAGFLGLVHPEDRDRVREAVAGAIARGAALDHQFRIVTPAGAVRWLTSRAQVLHRDDPARARLLGVDIDITALKETERALRARESELVAVQAAAGLAELEIDLLRDDEGIYSPAYRAMHEVAPGVVEHRADWVRRVHPDDRDRVLAEVEAAIAGTAGGLETEYRIVLPSGTLRWIEASMRIERDGEGRACRLVGAHRDVTLRREREEAQRAAETRLRAILDTMPPAVWSASRDGVRDFFSRRWFEITGLTESEGIDRWEEALHPDDRPLVDERWRESLAAATPLEVEARIRDAAGAYRWHLCRARPIRGADGAVERWYGTCSDIDARRRLEERLRLSEARLQHALDASDGVGTWDWDVPADIVHADARFARLFGVPGEVAAAGVPAAYYFAGVDERDRARVEAEVARCVAEGGAFASEYRVPGPDGGSRWISARGFAERDDTGRTTRFLGAIVDVSELKAIQEARELLARELAHRIKNVFGLLGAIASMSARGRGAEVESYASDLRARFVSLSRALVYAQPGVSLLADQQRDVTVLGLARELLEPFAPPTVDRLTITGEDASIAGDVTTGLALVLHELATNALKHGALSGERGVVLLDGRHEGADYVLAWTEEGGTPLSGPPERTGFGLQMADRTIARQLGGAIRFDWRRDGLAVELRMPGLGRVASALG